MCFVFYLILAWTCFWTNSRVAGDLRRNNVYVLKYIVIIGFENRNIFQSMWKPDPVPDPRVSASCVQRPANGTLKQICHFGEIFITGSTDSFHFKLTMQPVTEISSKWHFPALLWTKPWIRPQNKGRLNAFSNTFQHIRCKWYVQKYQNCVQMGSHIQSFD